jgi:hypothetical protein
MDTHIFKPVQLGFHSENFHTNHNHAVSFSVHPLRRVLRKLDEKWKVRAIFILFPYVRYGFQSNDFHQTHQRPAALRTSKSSIPSFDQIGQ